MGNLCFPVSLDVQFSILPPLNIIRDPKIEVRRWTIDIIRARTTLYQRLCSSVLRS